MPATNAVLHDKRYSADGVFCEPPQKLDAAAIQEKEAAQNPANSQSRWNTGDYHWEERDVTEFARKAASELLADRTLWSDRNGGALEVTDVALAGDAASNVRKGRRILTYALSLTLSVEGQRNGARLKATITSGEFCHDDTSDPAPALATEPQDSDPGLEVARAMKAHEMFTKVLKKKGLPLMARLVADLRAHLSEHKGDGPAGEKE
mmetsp:Transcript_13495/g.40179  ORF Transcript_13495/g.40179 Transcript_13495/m.40179 type:complete len:207 (+) Transcript_13495:395-1015(+)